MEEGESEDQTVQCPRCDRFFIRAYQTHFHLCLLSNRIYRDFFSDRVQGHSYDVIITDNAFRQTISTKDLSSHQTLAQKKKKFWFVQKTSCITVKIAPGIGFCAVKNQYAQGMWTKRWYLSLLLYSDLIRNKVSSPCQTGWWSEIFYTDGHAFQIYFALATSTLGRGKVACSTQL